MNKLLQYLAVVILFAALINNSYAIPPTFEMSIKNILLPVNPGTGADSVLQFDVYLQWTNSFVAGVDPFEYGSNQLDIIVSTFPTLAGPLFASRVTTGLPAGSLPPVMLTPSVQINPAPGSTWLFKGSSIAPNGANNFFIEDDFPGTCIGRYKIRTNDHTLPIFQVCFNFQLTLPINTFVAYMLPPLDPDDPDNQWAAGLLDTVTNLYDNVCSVSPVELANFSSAVNKNIVALSWSTVNETNNKGFDIERSVAGSAEWTRAGYTEGNGTVTEPKNYTFNERVSSGHYNYRLKQIDFNGNFEYYNLSDEVEIGIPDVYSISQNYPNPFNPSTKIDYELPYDGKVSILLYDISGKEVGRLVNEVMTAGYYTVQYNASNLSSGMYFYRISAQGNGQNFVQTKKMMLIK
ncbi:MAG: T9SS type A sorting domain-containing protein [Ignavibacteria bacterium]